MKDLVLSQWSLSEIISAKINRRIELLAEAHAITLELQTCGVLLDAVPSVAASKAEPADQAPESFARIVGPGSGNRQTNRATSIVKRLREDVRTCSCGEAFTVHKQSKRVLCDVCLKAARVAHIRAVHQHAPSTWVVQPTAQVIAEEAVATRR